MSDAIDEDECDVDVLGFEDFDEDGVCIHTLV